MIHPPTTSSLQSLLLDSHLRHSDPVSFGEVLETHAVPLVSLSALESGDVGRFLEMRHDYLRKRLADTANRLAEWGSTDRPPLNALIVPDGDRDD